MALARPLFTVSFALLFATQTLALNVDRERAVVRYVEPPQVSVDGLDYASLQIEVAVGNVLVGQPELGQTKSICVPKGSRNKLKDAVEVPTHFYNVPYSAEAGVMVVRDQEGRTIYSATIDGLQSSERFGYDQCKYWLEPALEKDFERERPAFQQGLREEASAYYERQAAVLADQALFFQVLEEKVPYFTFKDRRRDYTDLNRAAERARVGYSLLAGYRIEEGEAALREAMEIWNAALTESDPSDKKARINRKVTARLHDSLGAASMVLGDLSAAVSHLEKSTRMGMSLSRSDGTGNQDLLQRARRRKANARRNAASLEVPADLEQRIATAEPYRGQLPVRRLRPEALAALRSEHASLAVGSASEIVAAERAEHAEAVASGAVNPYEGMVQHTSIQGFMLFVMPFPEKLSEFPAEVYELEQLNQLRVPNHGFRSVADGIGRLQNLKVLDLSGNAIQELPTSIGELHNLRKLNLSGNALTRLPEEIGALENLKSLRLKGNPLAPGELERLERLLPDCKIKS